MTLENIEYIILTLALILLGVQLTSDFKKDSIIVKIVSLIVTSSCCAFFITILLYHPYYNVTIITRTIVPLIFVPILLYQYIVVSKDKIQKRYFFFIYCLPISILILSKVSIKTGGSPSNIFFIPMLLLVIFTIVCHIAQKTHRTVFMISGVLIIISWFFSLIMYQVIAGLEISIDNLENAFRRHSMWLSFVVCFFMGNWAKVGVFKSESIHKKAFKFIVLMFYITILSNQPELLPYLKRLPSIGNVLYSASSIGILIYPPLVGFIHRSKKEDD